MNKNDPDPTPPAKNAPSDMKTKRVKAHLAPPGVDNEAVRLTNAIICAVGDCEIKSALTAICNIAGQLVAHLSDGKPSEVKRKTESIAENIRMAAIAKLLHDDDARRAAKKDKQG